MKLQEKLKELKQSGGTKREITDGMLMLDQSLRDLGSVYTEEALEQAKNESKEIYKAISEVDPELGKMLILNIDM